MLRGVPHRRLPMLVIVAVVLFAFWRPLFTGATMAPLDQASLVEPYADGLGEPASVESAPPDAAAIHAAWADRAERWRAGEFAFWDDGFGAGAPVFRDAVPFTHLLYVLVPASFAPGLVAAVTMAIAITGARALAARRGATSVAALFAGLAYGCSGLLFVWFGWPHATALALVPWLWWSVLVAGASVRFGAARVAVVTAALLWAGVFAIAVAALVGAAAMAASEAARPARVRALVGGLLGVALAAPHLAAAWEQARWAASAPIATGAADWPTALTVAIGPLFGFEARGVPWLAGGTFQASIGFVGITATLLAVVGIARALRGPRRRPALCGLAVVGVAIAWVGGPFASAFGLVAGSEASATHARVLVVLPLVLLAADGLTLATDDERPRRQVAAALRHALPVAALVTVVGAAGLWRWASLAGAADVSRVVIATSVPSILAATVAVAVAAAWWRGAVDRRLVGTAACGLALFELLSFGMAIPTSVDADDRPETTVVHELVDATAGAHGRVGGLDAVLAPDLAPLLSDTADVRTAMARSEGEIALFTAADASSLLGGTGGSAVSPRVLDAAALDSGVWSAMGVDVIVASARTVPPGELVAAAPASRQVDAVLQPLRGSVEVPAGGIRGVEFAFSNTASVSVEVELSTDEAILRNRISVPPSAATRLVVPLAGDGVSAATADVVVRVSGEPSTATIGVDDGVTVPLGSVAPTGSGVLVMVDPLLVLARPTPPARFATSVVIEPDVAAAAALVDRWDGRAATAVADRPVGVANAGATAALTTQTRRDSRVARVDATGAGLVIFDVVAAPGWSVSLDGRTVEPVVADGAFIGVPVGAGMHTVELRYRPPHLRATLPLAMVAGLVVVWLATRGRRRAFA